MTTSRELALQALHTGLASLVEAEVSRGGPLPDSLPKGGMLILRDGEPGEPEVTMSPTQYHYEHEAELEIMVGDQHDPHAVSDALAGEISSLLASDRTLGGTCDWVEPSAPKAVDLPAEGGALFKASLITITLHYTSADPLG